jgi:hypothetical protein
METDISYDTNLEVKKTVIFWDWDDTLLCSSFLSSEGYRLDSDMTDADPALLHQLKELECSIIKVLEISLQKAETVIITNAETGWVQLSAQKFVPGVLPLLDKIRVVSARSTYESSFPDSPLKWKYCAFQDSLGGILQQTELEKHVISFGDSHVEREAVRAVTKNVENTLTKSIKFAERPTIEQLQRQVELATECFSYIHGHDGELDLCMSLSMVPTTQQPEQTEAAQAEHGTSNAYDTAAVHAKSMGHDAMNKTAKPAGKNCGMETEKAMHGEAEALSAAS